MKDLKTKLANFLYLELLNSKITCETCDHFEDGICNGNPRCTSTSWTISEKYAADLAERIASLMPLESPERA